MFARKQNISLVLEYMESDLEKVIKDPSLVLTPADVKAFTQAMLRALARCHEARAPCALPCLSCAPLLPSCLHVKCQKRLSRARRGRASACLEQAWVLHRDIKPNNLLLAPDGTLKVHALVWFYYGIALICSLAISPPLPSPPSIKATDRKAKTPPPIPFCARLPCLL